MPPVEPQRVTAATGDPGEVAPSRAGGDALGAHSGLAPGSQVVQNGRTSARSELAQTASPLPAHLPSLDGLRGIAIALVVVHNMGTLYEYPPGAGGAALGILISRGWVGVQLFFVLSGFLITGILLDTQSAHNVLSVFFARRTLRIWPLHYAVLIVVFVVLPALGPLPPTLAHDQAHQIWLWTYLSNWVGPFA